MKCPICSQALGSAEHNPFHPLCSQRCRAVDLGKWIAGDYVIAGTSGFSEGQDGFRLDDPAKADE